MNISQHQPNATASGFKTVSVALSPYQQQMLVAAFDHGLINLSAVEQDTLYALLIELQAQVNAGDMT